MKACTFNVYSVDTNFAKKGNNNQKQKINGKKTMDEAKLEKQTNQAHKKIEIA